MARILLIEPDRVFAALAEDRLRAAGLEVVTADDEAQALAAVSRRRPDAIVLDLDLPLADAEDLIRAVREQLASGPPPIVALSEPLDGPRRVAVLRAGATELLFRPIDLDELTIRVERLARSGGGEDSMTLEGRLDSTPLWEVLQFLEQAGKDGQLMVWDSVSSGRVRLARGVATGAEWATLRGPEALLAMLGLRRGRFRVAEAATPPPAGAEPLELRAAMMEAAWIEDEVAKRQRYLPSTGTPLRWSGSQVPELDEGLPAAPVEKVVAYLAGRPGARLYDLLSEGWAAPQRVRLAVAWLRERGGLEIDTAGLHREEFPSTTEIAASEVLDVAVEELARVARERGFESAPSHYLVLAEPGRRPNLEAALAKVPRSWRPEAVEALRRRMEVSGSGSLRLESAAGDVALHVHPLVPGATRARVESIVPICAGVLLWLDGVADGATVRAITQRLDTGGRGRGLLMVTDAAVREALAARLGSTSRWEIVAHEPGSLLGMLRTLGASAASATGDRRRSVATATETPG